jgi:hypothetical protein
MLLILKLRMGSGEAGWCGVRACLGLRPYIAGSRGKAVQGALPPEAEQLLVVTLLIQCINVYADSLLQVYLNKF